MKIELCEDNGLLNDGKPTLVVLVVTDDEGRSMRLPYFADKTIAELYEDSHRIFKNNPMMKVDNKEPIFITNHAGPVQKLNSSVNPDPVRDIANANTIEREDIVRCVKIHPREEGADEDLTIGDEYRVIDIKKKKGQVQYYDILDDNADNKYRITVLPDEVELLRKRKPKTNSVKKDYKQEIVKCDECKEENVVDKQNENDKYVFFEGTCDKCKAKIQHFIKKETEDELKNAESVAGQT